MIMLACASLDLLHLESCKQLVLELKKVVEADIKVLASTQSLANVAWSLACLGCLDQELLHRVGAPKPWASVSFCKWFPNL